MILLDWCGNICFVYYILVDKVALYELCFHYNNIVDENLVAYFIGNKNAVTDMLV